MSNQHIDALLDEMVGGKKTVKEAVQHLAANEHMLDKGPGKAMEAGAQGYPHAGGPAKDSIKDKDSAEKKVIPVKQEAVVHEDSMLDKGPADTKAEKRPSDLKSQEKDNDKKAMGGKVAADSPGSLEKGLGHAESVDAQKSKEWTARLKQSFPK